jgi:REP element-mobilizing transposase RayT
MIRNAAMIAGGTYHVYNRANGNEPMFCNPGNYEFFLKNYSKYTSQHWETHAWCLMPNHFHLIVTVKESPFEEDWRAGSQAFSNFANGYTQSFNRQHQRKGSLFMRSFRRKNANDEEYLRKLVCYIHNNPVKARIVDYPNEWQYSSYNKLLNAEESHYQTHPVLKLFGCRKEFRTSHVIQNSPGTIELFYNK